MKTTRTCRRLLALASLAAMAVGANALSVDPQIAIDRALNSPTLAVRYTGVAATLVELRINGESVGTREVAGARKLGETSFTIDLDALHDGDNPVEVVLYDRLGKVVGQDKSNISIAREANRGPVYVETPKAGATVRGPVEINVGFGEKLGRSYVSFFVDGQLKSITNFPPFTFVWDSEKEANGWHEIEAWAIDERNDTHKTGGVRLFVNNPGGRTARVGVVPGAILPSRNVAREIALVGADAGIRAVGAATGSLRVKGAAPEALPPAVSLRMVPLGNAVRAAVTGANGLRPVVLASALATGPKTMVPTGKRLATLPGVTTTRAALAGAGASVSKIPVVQIAGAVTNATMVNVVLGTRLPSLGSYVLLLDGQPVRFDVPTRVEGGLALAPLRSIIEKAGGKVQWDHVTKTVRAGAAGHMAILKIGLLSARVDGGNLVLEKAPGIEKGRTIVPLSFLHDALGMDVKYDKATGNVVVKSAKG